MNRPQGVLLLAGVAPHSRDDVLVAVREVGIVRRELDQRQRQVTLHTGSPKVNVNAGVLGIERNLHHEGAQRRVHGQGRRNLPRGRRGRIVPAEIQPAVVIAPRHPLGVAALIAEHQPLAADRAERLVAQRVGVPAHLDLALAVGAHLGDEVCPPRVRQLLAEVQEVFNLAGPEHDALGVVRRQTANLAERVPLLRGPVLRLPDERLGQQLPAVAVLPQRLHRHVCDFGIEEINLGSRGEGLRLVLRPRLDDRIAVAELAHSDFELHVQPSLSSRACSV